MLQRTLSDRGHVHGELGVLEAAVRTDETALRHEVFGPVQLHVEAGLEVALPEQRGAIAVLVEVRGDARCILGKRNAVCDDPVRPDVLPGEHRRTRGHAHRVLVVRALEVDAVAGEPVDHGCARDLAAVATQ